MTLQTLRLPRGLWADIEETVIHQDRQFLTEVARSLGLPVADVLRKCLGTGADQKVTIVGEDPGACPWWTETNGLWRSCTRLRLTPTTACQHHRNPVGCRLGSDLDLPDAVPLLFEGEIYYVGETVWREDGEIVPLRFKRIGHLGRRLWVADLRSAVHP
jgi:hypothetical protein